MWCDVYHVVSPPVSLHNTHREDGCLESELEDVLQPHEVAAVAAVGPGGGPAFVLQVSVMAHGPYCGSTHAGSMLLFCWVHTLVYLASLSTKLHLSPPSPPMTHTPNHTQVISELVEQCGVSDIKEDKMFGTLRSMGDTIAVCDKLLRYPLPLAWSRHTSRWGPQTDYLRFESRFDLLL